MSSIMPQHSTSTSRIHTKGILYLLEGELETQDREAGHDYLPMDVFIGPLTIKKHFQESSIRNRLTRTLSDST